MGWAIKPVYLKQLVSVYELSSEQELSIYPNPAQDNISIEMNGIPKDSEFIVEVLNTTGSKVGTKTIINSTNHFSIDVSNLQQGLYFVLIKTKSGFLQKSKLIIMR